MKWNDQKIKPNPFMDVVVMEPNGITYAQHVDFPSTELRGRWLYVGELVKEIVRKEDLLKTILYELHNEASSSEDYGTRKKAELLCELIKTNLYGGKNDASN